MAAVDPSHPEPPPHMLGHYRLLDLLGKGGMGEIFLAEDPIFERKVALKKILPKLIPYSSIKKRFLNEAKTAARLAHPSIIPIYALHMDSHEIYYTMPYIKGETLKEVLKKTREREKAGEPPHSIGISIPALMRIFLSVCQAIDYSHANGFLHRDLKPENIIVGKFGEVMIVDWGIARRIDADDSEEEKGENIPSSSFNDLTKPGKVVGTVNYMAPERAFGHPSTVQTDIYSLGVILYQLLTLRLPFIRASLNDLKKNLHQEHWIEPQELAPHRDIPLKLARVAKKCIHPNPDVRFASVREIIDELEDYIEGRPAWVPTSTLSPAYADDWEFQENVSIGKHMAISHLSRQIEWVMLMISKKSYSGNTKIETTLELEPNSSGIGFLLCVPNAEERAGLEEGYLIWIGSKSDPGCKLFRTGVEMIAIQDQFLTDQTPYIISIEKSDSYLRLFINGKLILNYISHLPLIGGHIGLFSRDASFKIDKIEVLLGSQSATVNCLAIPDAFLTSKDYTKALQKYRRIADSFEGREEAREARFRAGITLLEKGKSSEDPKMRETLFNEALDEFEKLHGTPGAPLEYLGKSLVYCNLDHLDEEIKCLELALRKYAKHPLLPLLEEHISFRLQEAAGTKREAAYSFLLLALRHLPRILSSKENGELIKHLTSSWEKLPFIEASTSLEAKYGSLVIELAFWLSKPTILYEMTHKLNPDLPEASLLLGNSLFTLLEMGYVELAEYMWNHLDSALWPLKGSDLKTTLPFAFQTVSKPLPVIMERALNALSSAHSFNKERLFSFLISQGLTREKAPSLAHFFDKVDRETFLPLYIWNALLSLNEKKAKAGFDRMPLKAIFDRNSPYYFLYGCYLALSKGEQVARDHFHSPIDLTYPPTSSILSYYLIDEHQLKSHWLPQAFSWEKIALYRQLALYSWCLGKEDEARHFEEKVDKERASIRIPLNFL